MTAEHPVGYVEVTVALAMIKPDGGILNRDMADLTVAFYIPSAPPPRPLTEDEVRETIRTNLSRVAAAIQSMLIVNGAVSAGQVDDPLTRGAVQGSTTHTIPVTVRVSGITEGRA